MRHKKIPLATEIEQYDQTFVIFGEPASKANSRRLVTIKGRPAFIKSAKANTYMEDFVRQAQAQAKVPPATGDVRVEVLIHYASRRPDLDDSVILDALQGIAYVNDRQVRQRLVYWGLDKDFPRAVIRVVGCDIYDVPKHLITFPTTPVD